MAARWSVADATAEPAGPGFETIRSPDVHSFPSPYSPAIRYRDLVAISGQVGVAPDGSLAGDGIEAQARQAFRNIAALLEAAGLTFANVFFLRYYLVDMDDWPVVARVREEFVVPPYPAGANLEVRRLVRPEWLIEIEALAVGGEAGG
jgi:enamine deaminase RidA (YjgF/YER057c/UK114 family)